MPLVTRPLLLAVLLLAALLAEVGGAQPLAHQKGGMPYEVHPRECAPLAEGQSLAFAEGQSPGVAGAPPSPPLLVVVGKSAKGFACRHVLETSVASSPPDTDLRWYHNGRLVSAVAVRDVTLNAQRRQALGFAQVTHRLCADPLVAGAPSKRADEFSVAVQSTCDASSRIRSAPVVVGGGGAHKSPIGSLVAHWRRAPLITLITTTRMELAGNFVQLMCRAEGSPAPRIHWDVLEDADVEGGPAEDALPIEKFPFIWEMTSGDLLVDTAKTDVAALSLRCTAANKYGASADTATLILLKED